MQERIECQDRMERRAIRDRVALDRHQVMRNVMLKGDLSEWLEQRIKDLEVSHTRNSTENVALMRNLLRGSKRRKRAIISELQSGSLRRAMSEDELGPGDEENEHNEDECKESNAQKRICKENDLAFDDFIQASESAVHPILVDLHLSSDQRRRRHAGNEFVHDLTTNLESLTVQSEFGFPSVLGTNNRRYHPIQSNMSHDQNHHHNMSYYSGHNNQCLEKDTLSKLKLYKCSENQSLEVSDHPHLYQNTIQTLYHPESQPVSHVFNTSRRNSIR